MIQPFKLCQHNTARGKDILQSWFEVAVKEEASLLFVKEPYLYFNSYLNQYSALSHPSFVPILQNFDAGIRPSVATYVHRQFPYEITARWDLIHDPDLQVFEVITP